MGSDQVDEECIQVNEETLWLGGPTNLNAFGYLPQARKAPFRGDDKTTEALFYEAPEHYVELYLFLSGLLGNVGTVRGKPQRWSEEPVYV